MSIGIYKIISPSGRIYVGQSENIETRWRDYKYSKSQTRLIRSFKKYGIDNHIFEIIEECTLEQLTNRENFWQIHYDVISEKGLNCHIVDVNTGKRVYTEESRLKMSEGRVGEKNHMFGKKLSREKCDRISKVHKGKVVSQKTKDKRKITLGDKQKGGGNPRAREVICVLTSITFKCITECAAFLNMNRKTLNDQLIGKYPNKTSFILTEILITDGGI